MFDLLAGRYLPPPQAAHQGPTGKQGRPRWGQKVLLVRAPALPNDGSAGCRRKVAEAWLGENACRSRDTSPGSNLAEEHRLLLPGGLGEWGVARVRALCNGSNMSPFCFRPPLRLFWRYGRAEGGRERRERERERARSRALRTLIPSQKGEMLMMLLMLAAAADAADVGCCRELLASAGGCWPVTSASRCSPPPALRP